MHHTRANSSSVSFQHASVEADRNELLARLPLVVTLADGFASPDEHHASIVAVFHLPDGTRIEVAVRDAYKAYIENGPRIDRHQILLSTPTRFRPRVDVIQVDDFRKLVGTPEAIVAIEKFSAGDLKGAARYVTAAGPFWTPLIDLLGGPA